MNCILKFRSPNLYTIIIKTKRKERVKGFFTFMTTPSLTMVRKSPANKVVVGLLSFLMA